MYKICKTEKSIERQKLFQTALMDMMKKYDYHEITVTSLCREMEIPRKTFYRYFDTLQDVMNLRMDETLTQAFLYLEVRPDLVGFFRYWKEQKELLDVLEKNGSSSMLVNRIYERTQTRFVEELTNEQIRYSGYISAIMTILLIWHHAGMKLSEEELSQQVKQLFKLTV